MREERDLQGAGGGGHLRNNAYTNPTLTTSIDIEKNTHFKGSNDFICEFLYHFVSSKNNEFVFTVDDGKSTSVRDLVSAAGPWVTKKVQNACTKKMLYKRLPILNWLPKYKGE